MEPGALSRREAGALPATVAAWREQGRSVTFEGRRIHLFTREGDDPALVLLHGFPSSSYDWRGLIAAERGQAILARARGRDDRRGVAVVHGTHTGPRDPSRGPVSVPPVV